MNYIRGAQGVYGVGKQLLRGEKISAENAERAKQFAYMLGTQTMLAGALGLPTEIFTVPLNAAYLVGLSPYNSNDFEAGFRRWADRTFGRTGGEYLSRGFLRALGIDLSGRLSHANLVAPFGAPSSTKTKDLQASAFAYLAGAPAGTAFEAQRGLRTALEAVGAYRDGAYDVAQHKFNAASKDLILFRQLNDVLAAVNGLSAEGMRTMAGRQRTAPYSIPEAIGRAFGFLPAREAEGREKAQTLNNEAQRIRTERSRFMQEYAQTTNASQKRMIEERIRNWNTGKPTEQQVSRADLLRAEREQHKRETQGPETLGLPTDRITRGLLGQREVYNVR
jgi:hypothetical protein